MHLRLCMCTTQPAACFKVVRSLTFLSTVLRHVTPPAFGYQNAPSGSHRDASVEQSSTEDYHQDASATRTPLHPRHLSHQDASAEQSSIEEEQQPEESEGEDSCASATSSVLDPSAVYLPSDAPEVCVCEAFSVCDCGCLCVCMCMHVYVCV